MDTSSAGTVMATASTWALVCLGALFVVRAPAALRQLVRDPRLAPDEKKKRPYTWFATGCGALALLTLGFLIPLPEVDDFLGGNNNAMLAEGILATGAFWFMFCALRNLADRPIRRREHAIPAALIAVFTVLFFMIHDRAGASRDFIPERIDQTASWAAITVYFTGIASMSAASLRAIRNMTGYPYVLFRIGYAATGIASLSDISFMTLAHFSLGTAASRAPFWDTFVIFFYGGLLFLVAGFVTVYAREKLRWRYYLYRLHPIHLRMKDKANQVAMELGLGDLELPSPKQERRITTLISALREPGDPKFLVYERMLAIRHMELYNRAQPLDLEREFLDRVDEALEELFDKDSIPTFTETFETSPLTKEVL